MIRIPSSILEIIRKQARRELPNEACGYLCGRQAGENTPDTIFEVMDIIEMTNTDASPEHFSFETKEQFAALKSSRDKGLSLIAVYHSHPETPARMSREDIRLANDTEIIYLIYSLSKDEIRGFKVDEKKNVTDYKVKVS